MGDMGIIFSAAMVRALLDGRKTQTRRLLSDAPKGDWHCDRVGERLMWVAAPGSPKLPVRLAYTPGDRLYVREAWSHTGEGVWSIADARMAINGRPMYRADHSGSEPLRWWPSIHMPRNFSRLWLAVTDVRVQRLQDVSEADAEAEGVQMVALRNYRDGYAVLWNSLHTEPGTRWEDNPWIVAVSFDVRRGNIDAETRDAA